MNQLRAQDEQGSAGNEQVCPPIAAESSVSAEVERTSGGGDVAAPERKRWRKGKRWPWLAGIALLATALLAVGGWFAAGAVARACCSRADAYYAEGSLDQALAEYERAIRLRPSYAEAYLGRGKAYHEKGDLERAIADYDQAIQLRPGDAMAYYNRGNAYADQGYLDRAIADYDRAVELQIRGLAYAESEAVSEAISILHSYGLDQVLTDQDDPRLWAAALIRDGWSTSPVFLDWDADTCVFFGVGIEDRMDHTYGMVHIEKWRLKWADEKHLRAVRVGFPRQSCPDHYYEFYISRPSAGSSHALVHITRWDGIKGGGATYVWRLSGRQWFQTNEIVAGWVD